MEIPIIERIKRIERMKGIASTVKAKDLMLPYTEGIKRFLMGNQRSMGDDWVKMAGSRLYNFSGKNEEGDILGSSTDMEVAIATFTDIPLIRGQELLKLYNQARKNNPFGQVYIDFGVQINGIPNVNSFQAKILMDELNYRGIKIEERIVLDFAQLRLIADKIAGLAYKLAEDIKGVASFSDYDFVSIGKNGLFRACLSRDGVWGAYDDFLANSDGGGRVVRYDAEGVAREEPVAREKPKDDLVSALTNKFYKRILGKHFKQ